MKSPGHPDHVDENQRPPARLFSVNATAFDEATQAFTIGSRLLHEIDNAHAYRPSVSLVTVAADAAAAMDALGVSVA